MKRAVGLVVAAVLLAGAPLANAADGDPSDDATGLLLRRDQFSDDGSLERVLAFDRITLLDTSVTAPPPPPAVTREVPQPLADNGMPVRLAAGYQRLAAFRTGSVLHVLYND